jgi:hypothetical protein
MIRELLALFEIHVGSYVAMARERIAEINARYAVPRIPMTPAVRFTLTFLRFYLFFMTCILAYKFLSVVL